MLGLLPGMRCNKQKEKASSAYIVGDTAGGSNSTSAAEAFGRQAGPVGELTLGGAAAAGHSPARPSGHQPAH